MSLAEKIQTDLVAAMRAKDELRLSVLRGIKSAIKLKEVEKIKTLDESETIQILQMLVKQRKESIEQFTKGNRPELAAKETKELAIIESYLPAGASEAEMDAAINTAIARVDVSICIGASIGDGNLQTSSRTQKAHQQRSPALRLKAS